MKADDPDRMTAFEQIEGQAAVRGQRPGTDGEEPPARVQKH